MKQALFLEQARAIIAIASTENDIHALQEAVAVMENIVAETPGVVVECFERSRKKSFLAYVGDSRPDQFRVLLNGHVDVVPAAPRQFLMQKEGDRLYGRGSLDMKLATLVMATVFCELAADLPYQLGLQIVSDEEPGGYDGTKYQVEQQRIDADFVIAGEPSGLDINVACKGFCRVRITLRGKAAHSAYLWFGSNAILKLMSDLESILRVYPVPKHEAWRTTVNVSNVSTSNQAINQVPAIASADLDIRYIAEDENFSSHEKLKKFFSDVDPELELEYISDLEPPMNCDQKNPLLKQLAEAVHETTGNNPALIRKHGSADARFYGNHAVTFGLAGEDIHGDHEYASYKSVEAYYQTLRNFLQRIR